MKNFRSFHLAMNKLNRVFLFSVAAFLFLISSLVTSAQAQPSVAFERMWVDYNIKEAGQDGMRLHVKFVTHNLKATECQLRVGFFYDDDTPIRDKNKKYYTVGGDVALFGDVKPGSNPAYYEDFQLFMPYDELDLAYGDYNLKMDVDLIYKADGEEIAHMKTYPFTYSKKPPATPPTTKTTTPTNPVVTFTKMWVEYDVTENDQFGMRIHAKFSISGMKGTKGFMAFFFERENGTRLKSYDNKFQSPANEVAVYKEITPGYEPSYYEDYSAFIPYSELHLTKGEHNLKIDADLTYGDKTLIQHLGYENFRYWKQ